MNSKRIFAILLQEYYHTKRSLEVIIDIFFFAVISMVAFGFISAYLVRSGDRLTAQTILVGLIYWEIIRTAQYSISVGTLFNIWSRNLSNIFMSPLTITEYMFAHVVTAAVKASIVFVLLSGIGYAAFDFNILALGTLNLLGFFLNIMIFAFTTGIAIIALIFRYGTRIQSLSWGLVFLFQPLSAVFYPVSVLPYPLQRLAYMFPSTYIFEAARSALVQSSFHSRHFLIALVLNIGYMIAALIFFNYLYKRSRDTGQFARNEG